MKHKKFRYLEVTLYKGYGTEILIGNQYEIRNEAQAI